MYQIIFDSEIIESTISADEISLVSFSPTEKNGFQFEKNPNILSLNLSQTDNNENIENIEFVNKISKKELNFTKELCSLKQITDYWVTFLNQKKWNSVNGGDILEQKVELDNKMMVRFNDDCVIKLNDDNLTIDEFVKICKHKNMKVAIKLSLYAIINKTQTNTNIIIRCKIREIVILKAKDKILNLFQIDEKTISKENNKTFFLPTYPMSKKKAVNNILQILQKDCKTNIQPKKKYSSKEIFKTTQ
jgi:hypothetical protein